MFMIMSSPYQAIRCFYEYKRGRRSSKRNRGCAIRRGFSYWEDGKKAQATLEFMFMFLAVIAFISILVGGMALAKRNASDQADVIKHTVKMNEIARTIEAHSNTGMIMIFDVGDETYRIEGDSVKTDYRNKTIVVEGILTHGGKRLEPV